ncbi:MAG: ATP-grasp domain-containing protein [Treponemataceae bacterium]|nr:ATP-grasp domain-containing protein [Treponemataceae bacterium]
MAHVLILGAGLMQKPAIDAAKKLGFTTVVVDANPAAVCVPMADRFEPVDLKDRESLLSLALELKNEDTLAGVFTAGTDFSASVSYITEKLGLPGHSFQAACNASDKILMRRCFAANGVPSPVFFEVSKEHCSMQADELLIAAGFHSFPLVVKPVDNMGARGCRMIQSPDDLMDAVNIAVSYSRTGRAILEEYMDGIEFSIDSLVFDGEMTVTGFADRHIFYPPYFIEMGHTLPSAVSERDKKALFEAFFKGVKALGLTHGAAKADIKMTSKGPMLGEIAARLSGGYMSGWTFPYASGLNLTEQALLLALGKKPSELIEQRQKTDCSGIWEIPCRNTSAERAWISVPGTIDQIYGLEKHAQSSFVENLLPRSIQNDEVSFPQNNVEKCGNVISCAPTREEAVATAHMVIKNIVLRLKPEQKVTDDFLSLVPGTDYPPAAYPLSHEVILRIDEIPETDLITDDVNLLAFIPGFLQPYADTVVDWNRRTIAASLDMFSKICPKFKPLKAKTFWRYLLRGGIQGILYLADSAALKTEDEN